MTDRDKLKELIINSKCVEVWDYYNDEMIKPCPIERLADYLLANGVIVPKQGKWKIKRDDCDFEYMVCSCCKEEFFPEGCVIEITPNFCPNCGAKMKEREGK
jgi:hypothetical protein